MKKSILTLLTVAALTACKKNESTVVDQSTDSTATAAPVDSGMTTSDSATTTSSTTSTALSEQDKKFADGAARGGLMEVMMGELAATNATNPTVKALGKMMVDDHSKANEELKKWASIVEYTLPTGLDTEKQKEYDELKAKKGADFDRAYTDLMVSDHKKDIAEFKKEASDGSEASLKSFAGKTVPTLEHHLMESEKAKSAVK
ncbi:DUF4142 domain-containing protein [Chryseobacterium wanjuense]